VPGFSLGIYVFKDAEIVDFAAPHGAISVARRFDAELDAFLIMGLLDGLAATNRKEPDRAESRHGLGDGDGGGSASESGRTEVSEILAVRQAIVATMAAWDRSKR
jgi:hypothetical protein